MCSRQIRLTKAEESWDVLRRTKFSLVSIFSRLQHVLTSPHRHPAVSPKHF